jgi:tetratricopeptide (TPR) repeat protein
MALDLATRLLSEEIRTLHAARSTGILEVTSSGVGKGVYLRAGAIVFASSSLDEDRLGESLIRLGRISRADFAAAYRLEAGRKRRRIGQVLVGAGLISEDELGKLVSHQVESVILSIFRWTSGEMRFHESRDPVPIDLALDLSTHRLLLEGIRVFPDEARLLAALGDRRRKLRSARRPPFDYGRVPLSMVERTVLDEATRGARIADILAGPTPKPRIARALYALLASGIVEDAEAPAALADEPVEIEEDARTFRVAIPEPPAAAPEPEAEAETFDVDDDGPGDADEPPPPPTWADDGREGDTIHDLNAAAGAAPEAASDEARADLLRLYEALPRATHYAVLGLRPTATLAEVKSAYARLSEDQDRRWKSLESDARLGTAIFTLKLRRREAHEALSDPERRLRYDRALGQMQPVVPEPAPTLSMPRLQGAGRTVAELVSEAEALQTRGEGDRALSLLLRAVEKDPQDHPARRALALALAGHPALAPKAERHFLAALEQDPLDTELRYRLAVFYRKAGFKARAILHLRVVLGRDAGHAAAIKDLQELQSS